MHLSVIIPAYNEAERIAATLEELQQYFQRQEYSAEIIVVDDGSQDATRERVGEATREAPEGAVPVQLVSLPENRGKGYAVRTGLQRGSGDYRLFYDADGSTPIAELEKVWPVFADGAEVVIGSRAHAASQIEIRQAWYREGMGRIFNLLLRLLGLSHFRDTQCGFKAFTAEACEVVLPRQTVDRFSFDAELLHIAGQHGLRVTEIPVRWLNSPNSRVDPLRDATQMFWDLLKIRLRGLRGVYD